MKVSWDEYSQDYPDAPWYIYLHDWVIIRANVRTYSIHGAYRIWIGVANNGYIFIYSWLMMLIFALIISPYMTAAVRY